MSSNIVRLSATDEAPGPRGARRSRRRTVLEEQRRSFLRMVSHELRTPLNSIIGFSEILSNELCGPLGAPQYKDYAEHVRQSGQKLLRLVNQVLEIARLEGQVTDLDIASEDLHHALDDVQATLREDIAARGVSIIINGEDDLPHILADARALRTVLANILQNAVTFSPQGGKVRVHVILSSRFADIAVTDEGEGIVPGDVERLLKPFEQGENALTRTSEGAGLGLPIAHLYCQAMGGDLMLHAVAGHGVTSFIRLRRAS
jgi:signal transduction histidine kinase